MFNKKKIASSALGISVGALGVIGTIGQLNDKSLRDHLELVVINFFLLLLIVLFSLFCLYEVMQDWFIRSLCPRKYIIRYAKHTELDDIRRLAEQEMGTEVSSLEEMRFFYECNPSIFFVLRSKTQTKYFYRDSLVGYYSIIPLSPTGLIHLKSEQSARDLNKNDISSQENNENILAVYIGGVAAIDRSSRNKIMVSLKKTLEEYREKQKVPLLVFTTPVNKTGINLCHRHNFSAVNPANNSILGSIYSRTFEPLQPVPQSASPAV